ncbi:MAG: tRNA (guanosine(37)-N1)-methyltransferase TrmD [Bifidobacteriaceae bacterium]|jgi:tRNA (guanine37-N1)-methyltransferase|nr:tRNA (guanosine(37)-N1)-methyltransferase TrmD [Bifidobacteriaceae bacterium]
MKIDIITYLPAYFKPLELSLIAKAFKNKIIDINVIDLHDFGIGIHKSVDDTPYGGGSGMILRPDVAQKAIDSVIKPDSVLIIPTARGYQYKQTDAKKLSKIKHLVFLNSRFEGYDERIVDYYAKANHEVLQYSIGDYILFGSEVATLVILESAVRLIPGVLGNSESLTEESLVENLLEYDSYTRPRVWQNLVVPEVLVNGNHKKIVQYRKDNSICRTKKFRPDLTS